MPQKKRPIIRDWKGYKKQNSAGFDCQLVTTVNAYYFLTGKTVSEKQYNHLAVLTDCRFGSAVSIEKAWKKLGLGLLHQSTSILGKGMTHQELLPLEINVWHKSFGYHSILAVEWEPRTEAWRVTNFQHVANNEGWIFDEDLRHFVIAARNKRNHRWSYRTFGLLRSGQSQKKKRKKTV